MSIEQLRRIVADLQVSAGALAALGATLDTRVNARVLDPAIAAQVEMVVAELISPHAMNDIDSAQLRPVLAELRIWAIQNTQLVFRTPIAHAWSHTNSEILQAAGDASAGFASALKHNIAQQMPGMIETLKTKCAKFLDIGIGVGALSIGMAREWPLLSVVGIDPWGPALELARKNIRAMGLLHRIELRQQRAEELSDSQVFDLAWLPGAFVPSHAINSAAARIYAALRPGGWLLLALIKPGEDPRAAALARLRTALFGGCLADSETVATTLRRAGFIDVRLVSGAAATTVMMLAARRKP